MGIIVFMFVGLIAGVVARALVPGPDRLGLVGTAVLGVVGAVVGAVLILLVWRSFAGPSRTTSV